MTSLLSKIQKDQIQARTSKQRDEVAVSLLTTLFSEAANVGKNQGNRESTDDEVVAVVKKFVKVAEQNLEIYEKAGKEEAVSQIKSELAILSNYLPKAPSVDEIKLVISNVFSEQGLAKEASSVGRVMKELKAQYGSALDGALASKLIKEFLV